MKSAPDPDEQFPFLASLLKENPQPFIVWRSLSMWSDNETVDDLIGFRVHAELLREVVCDGSLLPVTIGVFGDWGSGKTSIMKMLEKELAKDEDVAVVYFDAWLFEGYDDAKSALITSILKQLVKHKRFPPALKKEAAKLIGRVNWMRLLKMGWDNVALPAVLAYATGGATAVPSVLVGLKTFFSPNAKSILTAANGGSHSRTSAPTRIMLPSRNSPAVCCKSTQ
jgi:hypothetical protein